MPTLLQKDQYVSSRISLTANRTYYVRTDGSDSNDGLTNTSGGAFLTAAKVNTVISTIDKKGYDIVVQFGAGTWSEDIIINAGIGDGTVTWKGTLTLLESVTSATVAAGSGATAGTVTKTGQFTGDVYTRYLCYFVTDAVYRVIYSNTANALTLSDIAPSSTTQNVEIYSFGTIVNSITIPKAGILLNHLKLNNDSSANGFSLELDPSASATITECSLGKTFINQAAGRIDDCVFTTADTQNTSVAYSGTCVYVRNYFHIPHNSGVAIVVTRGGYALLHGGTIDGDAGGGNKATYGIRIWGACSYQQSTNFGGYVKLRNLDTGRRAETYSVMVGTNATVSETNVTTSSSTDGIASIA